MLCFSDSKIALQGSFFFFGFLLGAVLWMRLTDFWGRKRMIVGGLLLFILTLSIYLVEIDFYSICASLFLLGF